MRKLPNTQFDHLAILDHGTRPKTTAIVIHCIEGSAAGAKDYFASGTGGNPGVGAHVIMGPTPEHTWQLTDLDNKCWHAVAANSFAIGFEHEGFSADSTATWMKRANMLHRSAARVAWCLHEYNLGRPKHGVNIFAHSDGGVAWGNHGDPGGGWPWRTYIALVLFHYMRHWGRK